MVLDFELSVFIILRSLWKGRSGFSIMFSADQQGSAVAQEVGRNVLDTAVRNNIKPGRNRTRDTKCEKQHYRNPYV